MGQVEDSYHEFVALLRECTGQEAELIGEATLARAVREGMALSRTKDPEAFLVQLRSNSVTRQRFINAVTIGESWFFRDEAPFQFLGQYLVRRATSMAEGDPIGLLSLPCANGEEAYSLAMTAHEAGLKPSQCHVEGMDINTLCLRRAREGIYQGHAFRSLGAERLLRYFDTTEDGYAVRAWLKDYVTFFRGSVVDPEPRLLQRRYDVVLFRNLLIYLGTAARRRALTLVRELLKPEGILIVGHAETGIVAAAGFAPEGTAYSFAFCRDQRPPAAGAATLKGRTPPEPEAESSATRDAGAVVVGHEAAGDHSATLQEVERLANGGNIEEAQRRCTWLLAAAGNDPQVCYLCAIVAEAAGQGAEAEQLLRQTIAQCPGHYPALVHLAASLASRGAEAEAHELRRRAEQLATGSREQT